MGGLFVDTFIGPFVVFPVGVPVVPSVVCLVVDFVGAVLVDTFLQRFVVLPVGVPAAPSVDLPVVGLVVPFADVVVFGGIVADAVAVALVVTFCGATLVVSTRTATQLRTSLAIMDTCTGWKMGTALYIWLYRDVVK